MIALGIVTLLLLVFTLVYYAYLANHSEKDVSFFMSVSLIMLVMNLATNTAGGGILGISWLYFAVALIFIGVGFAVDTHESVAFYQSIGPWFKNTFSNMKLFGWQVLSSVLFPAGVILYFVWYNKQGVLARECGKCAMWGLLAWAMLLWMILGPVL